MQIRMKPSLSLACILATAALLLYSCKYNPDVERRRMLRNLFKMHQLDLVQQGAKDWTVQTSKLEKIEITNGRHTGLSLLASVDSIYYVKLETSKDCLIGRIDKLYEGNGKIVIIDKDFAKEIFVYDRSGKFLSKISQLGEGPQHYKEITDASVDFTKEQIVILDRVKRRMFFYAFDGKFISAAPLAFYIDFFEYLKGDSAMIWSNRNFLNSHLPAIEKFSLFMARPEGKVLQKSFPFEPKHTGEGYNYWNIKTLSRFGNDVYFNPRMSDYIFRVGPDSIEAMYYLDMKGRSFTETEQADLTNAVYEKRNNENDFFMFNGDFAINDNYVYCKIINKVRYFGCFYNREYKKATCFSNIAVDHPDAVLFNFPYTGSNDFFVTVLNATDIVSTKDKLKNLKKSPAVVKLFNSVLSDDNPVLMYYSFK